MPGVPFRFLALGRRRRRARSLVLASTLAANSLFATALGIGVASAYVGECNDSQIQTTVSNMKTSWVFTHDIAAVSVPPGATYIREITQSMSQTVTATVDQSISVTAGADAVIYKASATLGYSLKMEGSKTTSTAIKKTWKLPNPTTKQRYYAILQFTKKVTGQYAQRTCSRTEQWQPWKYGSFVSWQTEWDAAAYCPRTNYPVGSAEYMGLMQIGC